MTLALVRLLSTERFDLIHAHWLLPQGLIGLLGTLLFRLPLVVTVHGTDAFALQGNVATRLKRLVLNKANAWTTNTAMTANVISRDFSVREPRTIPMGVDIARFSGGNPELARSELPENEHLVLFVGRLIQNKGCDDLLRAISLLSLSSQSRTTLWIVGAGDQRTSLEQTARDLGIQEKVRFSGTVSHQQLPDFYAAADIVAIPSRLGSSGEMEGQGVVALEAFAARACVVATRIGGIISMVRDQSTGLLVEPGDPQALAMAIEQLLNEPELRQRLTDRAFAEVRNQYGWARIAFEFDRLYHEVLGSFR
jgi:glycosyltransferase involved in cell wall biosynthesis